MLKKILIITISFYLTLFSFHNIYAEEKIAFIDLNYLFNNSAAGKKINEQIKKKTKDNKSKFDDLKKKIDIETDKLKSQKNVISNEEYQKKFIELQKNVQKYNMTIEKNNKNLIDFQNKARSKFSLELKSILEEYSKNNSIAMIIRKENLLIGKNSLDVTKGILELFNKNVKQIKIQ